MTVHVVGNTALDTTIAVPRLPGPGETASGSVVARGLGGKGANQAVAASRAGARVAFHTALGDDADGRWLRSLLEREALDLAEPRTVAAPTDRSTIYRAPDGENVIVTTQAAARALGADAVRQALAAFRPDDLLMVQGNLRPEVIGAALQEAKARGGRTLFNPAPVADGFDVLWEWTDTAVLNAEEAGALCPDGPASLLARGPRVVIVTRGAGGCRVAKAGSAERALPAPRVTAVDTAGAGDAFCGVLAAGIERGLALPAAVAWAMRVAAVAVARPGTSASYPTAEECRRLLDAVGREDGAP